MILDDASASLIPRCGALKNNASREVLLPNWRETQQDYNSRRYQHVLDP
jgi:hypothetical protein